MLLVIMDNERTDLLVTMLYILSIFIKFGHFGLWKMIPLFNQHVGRLHQCDVRIIKCPISASAKITKALLLEH